MTVALIPIHANKEIPKKIGPTSNRRGAKPNTKAAVTTAIQSRMAERSKV